MYINFSFIPFYEYNDSFYKYIFIVALITLAIIIMLKSSTLFIIQAVMLFGITMIAQMGNALLEMIFTIIQIGFTIWMIYKIKLAIDYNYQLILEKTHLAERKITEHDYTGTRKSY